MYETSKKVSLIWFLLVFCLHRGSGDNGTSEFCFEKRYTRLQRELSLQTIFINTGIIVWS